MTINDPNNFAPIHFNLPEVACSTPPRVNPDYPTIYERNAAWVRRFLPFPSAEALERMLENRYPCGNV